LKRRTIIGDDRVRCRSRSAGRTAAVTAVVLSGFFSPAGHAAEADKLRHLLDQDCGSCHGLTRKGGLGPSLEAKALARFSDDDLVAIIMNGLPGTAMPPWKAVVTGDETRALVRMLRTEAKP
jgi:cytochrome c55X